MRFAISARYDRADLDQIRVFFSLSSVRVWFVALCGVRCVMQIYDHHTTTGSWALSGRREQCATTNRFDFDVLPTRARGILTSAGSIWGWRVGVLPFCFRYRRCPTGCEIVVTIFHAKQRQLHSWHTFVITVCELLKLITHKTDTR